VETLGNLLRWSGLLAAVVGLWFSAGGMRVLVSGRVDERRRSANSLKRGLPLLLVGVLFFIAGTWLADQTGP